MTPNTFSTSVEWDADGFGGDGYWSVRHRCNSCGQLLGTFELTAHVEAECDETTTEAIIRRRRATARQ